MRMLIFLYPKTRSGYPLDAASLLSVVGAAMFRAGQQASRIPAVDLESWLKNPDVRVRGMRFGTDFDMVKQEATKRGIPYSVDEQGVFVFGPSPSLYPFDEDAWSYKIYNT